jgi:hypothetical protein
VEISVVRLTLLYIYSEPSFPRKRESIAEKLDYEARLEKKPM